MKGKSPEEHTASFENSILYTHDHQMQEVAQQEPLVVGHVDLGTTATHGRSSLQHLLLGSVTEQGMNDNTLPALVIHPSGQGTQAHMSSE